MQGSIKDFSVADILQLMSQQQKTGVLIVENNKRAIEVYFAGGEIAEVKAPNDNETLGSMLVKSQLVTEGQLHKVMEAQKNSLEHVCNILLHQHVLTKEQFDHVLTTYSYEIFYEILQWRSGTYHFIAQKSVRQPLVVLPGIESILLDVLRMIDEWPDIQKIISSFDMLFDNNYAALADLDAEEERVCQLVDGRRSARDIIDASLLGTFYTCKALVQLLERGAIRLLSSRAEPEKHEKGFFAKTVSGAAAFAGFAIVILLIFTLPGSFLKSTLPAITLLRPQSEVLRHEAAAKDMRKIEKALGMFFFKTGTYPDSLAELGAKGILSAGDISALLNPKIAYTKTAGSYEITIKQ